MPSLSPLAADSEPVTTAAPVAAVPKDASSASASGHASGEQTVLIVDDDSALRCTAAMLLEGHGFKTLVACHGLEALEQLESNPQISAVLLDLLMPVMDGVETFRQIRRFWAGIPVILTSGFALEDLGQRLGNPPPDGFIQKPFTFAKLTHAFDVVLN
jgi:CheY-like chemotaxis protein